MTRHIFITDLHSEFTKFKNLLNKAEYNKSMDTLILGGDYFDRGKEAHEMARYLEENYQDDNIILLRGNHDQPLIDLLTGGWIEDARMFTQIEFMLLNNGTLGTLQQLSGGNSSTLLEMQDAINKRYPHLLDALLSTKYYHETDAYIYTHATLPRYYKEATQRQWELAIQRNSFEWAKSRARQRLDKPICIGHYSLSNLTDNIKPMNIKGIIFCDGGLGWGREGTFKIN